MKASHFIVNSNIWISLGAVALVLVTDLLGNTCYSSWHLYSIVFFATLLTYNWQRFLSVKKRQQYAASGMRTWVGSNLLSGYMASAVAAAICAYNFLHLHPNQQSALVLPGIISVLYALPILPSGRGMIRLRDFGITKPFVLGITWGLVTGWLPIIVPTDSYTSFPLPESTDWLFVWARCFFLIALCIPFDVKDIQFDSATMAYPTLPVKFGINHTIVLAMGLSLSGYMMLSVWLFLAGWGWPVICAGFVSLAMECWFIRKTNANSPEWHYTVVLDGILLLHSLLLAVGLWVDVFIAAP
ncbi:hypothetical protein BH09BAC1_BH09BAC1_11800 [soil metagenome]